MPNDREKPERKRRLDARSQIDAQTMEQVILRAVKRSAKAEADFDRIVADLEAEREAFRRSSETG